MMIRISRVMMGTSTYTGTKLTESETKSYNISVNLNHDLRRDARKLVFGLSDQV